jgi:hypothetical protein
VPDTNDPPSNGGSASRELLLGSVRGRRRRALERLIFDDDDLFESVLAEEDALVDDYVGGRLSEPDRARFAAWTLRRSGGREATWAAERLRQALISPARAPAATPRLGRQLWWILRRPGLDLALAASLVVVLGGAAWLAVDAWRLRGRIERLQAEHDALRARRQQASDRAQEPSAGPILTFSLSPGLVRGHAPARPFVVAPSAVQVRLQLELREEPGGRIYRAELQTPDGHVLFSESGLAPARSTAGRFVDLLVPAALLTRGDYILMLSASAPGAPLGEVDSYVFSVAASP